MLCLLTGSSLALTSRSDFEAYKGRFGKSYASVVHEEWAFAAYVKNMEWVEVNQALAQAEGASVVYGETKFSDMTPEGAHCPHPCALPLVRIAHIPALSP